MARQDLVPESKIIEEDAVTIQCAHGDTVLYPIAQLQLEGNGIPLCIEAALSKSLPMPVLLGTDVAVLHQLPGESTAYPQIKYCIMHMVVTHMQTMWKLQENTNTRSKKCECGAKPNAFVKVSEEP